MKWLVCIAPLTLLGVQPGRAQDAFEIQVCEYVTVPPSAEQVHQFFLGGDLELSENAVTNFGIGFGATDAGNRLVYKARLGWLF